MRTIRGAITINENKAEEITEATTTLLREIIKKNDIQIDSIIYILFTATDDVDKAYPAAAARAMGITYASLMCMQEMKVEGYKEKCIRVMVAIDSEKTQREMVHCYLGGAAVLRPDLQKEEEHFYSVAIDGPTASGKSTIAREVAKRLKIGYVDTGAMYRAVALHCMKANVNYISGIINELDKFQLSVKYVEGEQLIYLDGEDVTETIRTQEVAKGASVVAEISEVREKLTQFQRSLAKNNSVVMDGRDIGTVVLPESAAKIFITASIEERTKRRCIDLEKKGIHTNFGMVQAQIEERDNRDTGREFAPLVRAEGAVEIDTTQMTKEETVDKVIEIIKQKLDLEKNGINTQ